MSNTADQYEINMPPRKTYKHIAGETWLLTAAIALIPIVVMLLAFGFWQFALGMGTLVFLASLVSLTASRYHINRLRIAGELVEIWYTKRGKEKFISGSADCFMFSIQTWELFRPGTSGKEIQYRLLIQYNGKPVLHQYPQTGSWTQAEIIQTAAFFNRRFSSAT